MKRRGRKLTTFEEAMYSIRKLVKNKGHEDTTYWVPQKFLFAFIELGEAADEWKKHGFANSETVAEEIIDTIFYLLDAYGLLVRDIGVPLTSEMFRKKMLKNQKRPHRYGRPKE